MEEPKISKYDEVDYKIPGLSRFLIKFARDEPKDELEDNIEIKQQQKQDDSVKKQSSEKVKSYLEIEHQNFTKQIINSKEAALIYFTTVKDDNLTAEYKQFNKLTRTLKGAIQTYVFRLDKSSPDFAEMKKTYKLTKFGDQKPELRFYPNQLTGEMKDKASFAILFNKDEKDIEPIISEI